MRTEPTNKVEKFIIDWLYDNIIALCVAILMSNLYSSVSTSILESYSSGNFLIKVLIFLLMLCFIWLPGFIILLVLWAYQEIIIKGIDLINQLDSALNWWDIPKGIFLFLICAFSLIIFTKVISFLSELILKFIMLHTPLAQFAINNDDAG